MSTFWTIQSLDQWNKAKDIGYLVGDKNYIIEDFEKYYLWMMKQMSKRLSDYNGEYPIWLWPKRPDLRMSGYLPKGKPGVLLQIDLDEKNVLLSDFIVWHIVLNDGFISITDEEEELYDQGKSGMTKEQSWERIFDFHLLKKAELIDMEELQGVTGKIDIKNIKSVKKFVSR